MWLAVDGAGKKVLGFTLGARSEETGAKLYKSLVGMKISSYYTDYWSAYSSTLYQEHHIQGKAESMNSLVHHRLARFRRRGKYCSKSIEMAEHSLRLLFHKLSMQN